MRSPKNQNLKYLVVNPVDESWGLFVNTIGFQIIQPESDYPPKSHPSSYWFNPVKGRKLNEYAFIYITKGEGEFESENCKKTKLSAGSVVLLYPDEWHTYNPDKKTGWQEYWIGFNGNIIESLIKNNFFSKEEPVIYIGLNEQMIAIWKQGIEIASFQKAAYQQMLSGIAQFLISNIFYLGKNNSFRDKETIEWINKARAIMTDNTDNRYNPEEIAGRLNISYSWFRRIFKNYTGLSPIQYQMQIRLQKAKELLTSSSISVKEIAYDLNFESTSYFVTFFKSQAGMTPTQYRKMVHEV